LRKESRTPPRGEDSNKPVEWRENEGGVEAKKLHFYVASEKGFWEKECPVPTGETLLPGTEGREIVMGDLTLSPTSLKNHLYGKQINWESLRKGEKRLKG